MNKHLPRLSGRDLCIFDLASRGLPATTIAALLRLAPKAKRRAEYLCNGYPDGVDYVDDLNKDADDARPSNPHSVRFAKALLHAARVMGTANASWTLVATGDPRGYCLRVTHPTLRGNTLGGTNEGDEYVIHGS